MPHADFPSATSCICIVFGKFAEAFLGTPGEVQYFTSFHKGCSLKEPGALPSEDTSIRFNTTKDFVNTCAYSRVWAGVHYTKAVDAALKMCEGIGAAGFAKLNRLKDGTAYYEGADRKLED
eukprot:gene23342-30591_t